MRWIVGWLVLGLALVAAPEAAAQDDGPWIAVPHRTPIVTADSRWLRGPKGDGSPIRLRLLDPELPTSGSVRVQVPVDSGHCIAGQSHDGPWGFFGTVEVDALLSVTREPIVHEYADGTRIDLPVGVPVDEFGRVELDGYLLPIVIPQAQRTRVWRAGPSDRAHPEEEAWLDEPPAFTVGGESISSGRDGGGLSISNHSRDPTGTLVAVENACGTAVLRGPADFETPFGGSSVVFGFRLREPLPPTASWTVIPAGVTAYWRRDLVAATVGRPIAFPPEEVTYRDGLVCVSTTRGTAGGTKLRHRFGEHEICVREDDLDAGYATAAEALGVPEEGDEWSGTPIAPGQGPWVALRPEGTFTGGGGLSWRFSRSEPTRLRLLDDALPEAGPVRVATAPAPGSGGWCVPGTTMPLELEGTVDVADLAVVATEDHAVEGDDGTLARVWRGTPLDDEGWVRQWAVYLPLAVPHAKRGRVWNGGPSPAVPEPIAALRGDALLGLTVGGEPVGLDGDAWPVSRIDTGDGGTLVEGRDRCSILRARSSHALAPSRDAERASSYARPEVGEWIVPAGTPVQWPDGSPAGRVVATEILGEWHELRTDGDHLCFRFPGTVSDLPARREVCAAREAFRGRGLAPMDDGPWVGLPPGAELVLGPDRRPLARAARFRAIEERAGRVALETAESNEHCLAGFAATAGVRLRVEAASQSLLRVEAADRDPVFYDDTRTPSDPGTVGEACADTSETTGIALIGTTGDPERDESLEDLLAEDGSAPPGSVVYDRNTAVHWRDGTLAGFLTRAFTLTPENRVEVAGRWCVPWSIDGLEAPVTLCF